MKTKKKMHFAHWGFAMLLATSMATSVFAEATDELVITKQPEAAYVAVSDSLGGTVTISIEAKGAGDISYQWYKSFDGTNENGTVIEGATGSSYTTEAFTKPKRGMYYYCVATAGEKSVKSNVTVVANTGLPTFYVNTPDGEDLKDEEKEKWIKETKLTLKDAGTENFENISTQFRGRGNSTWEQPKKPYAIKLDEKKSILGMPKHKRWVLIANYLDNSFLKNQIAFYLSGMLEMDYTVRGQFVNLVFNGVYRGLYWLGEAIKVDKNRVKIYDGEDGMDDEDDKDFLIEMDTHFDEVAKFYTPIRKMPYMIKNDDYIVEDVLNEKGKKVKDEYGNTVTQVSTVGQARLARFQDKIAALENLLYPDYNTNNDCKVNTNYCSAPDEAYKDIIDVESWAKFWLINEIMDNTELMGSAESDGPKSAYFTYQNKKEGQEGDVFKAGPVWDFDAGAKTLNAPIKLDTTIYYNALFKSPSFVAAVKNVWNTFISENIEEGLESGIESAKERLGTAAKLDSMRWGAHKDYVQTTDLSFSGSVDFLKTSLKNKINVVGDFVNNKMVDLSTLTADYEAEDGRILTGTLAGNYKITIKDGATVTLDGVTINRTGDDYYEWAGITCEGDCKIILAEGTTNTVSGFNYNYPGIYVPEGKTLTIDGNGELSASTVSDEDGWRYAAGIGGGLNMSCGNIVINNGIINATGGEQGGGAGIGAGVVMGAAVICGNITISGGTVTATVGIGSGGAGIGAGYNSGYLTMGDITISGGTVTATVGIGGGGAGIGAGLNEGSLTMGDITISGGIVTATVGKESAGAGIGTGHNSGNLAMGDIKISGGTVTATVDKFGNGAGIGAGGNISSLTMGNITISGGTVTATGAGAGIGIGYNQGTVTCKGITISKEVTSLIAIKGEYADHSIGIGYNDPDYGGTFSCDKITIGGEETNFIETSPFIFPKRTYTVAFDGNGGSGSMESQILNLGDVLQANTFTRQGYVFDGWNTAKDGSGMSFKDGAKVLEFLGTNTNVTFYAQWWDGTFSNVVDLADLTGNYVAEFGDVLTGKLGGNYKVSIADGAIVELNGVTINGINSQGYNWAGITCEGSCTIVLAEGSTNIVEGFYEDNPGIHVPEGSTLTIEGSGTLEASSYGYGAGIGGGYNISCGNIVIKGGTVTATGGKLASGIGSGANASCGDITITNGVTKVTAIKDVNAPYSIGKEYSGIVGTITIGSNVVTDGIKESPYVFIPPLFEVVESGDGKKLASFNGNFIGTEPLVIAEETSVDKIEFNRSFPTGKFSTVVLPFDVKTSEVSGLDAVLRYNGIGKDKDGNDAIRMKVVWATDKWVEDNQIKDKNDKLMQYAHVGLTANTPYMMQMSNPTFKVNNTAPIVLKQTAKAETDKDGWTFRGTWEYRKWEEGDSDLGYAYGFAASASDDDKIQVGDFVRVGVGAWIAPMRAYLVSNNIPVQAIRANGNYVTRPSVVRKELPELMSVIIGGDEDSSEEQTTVIGHFNTRTGEFKMNRNAGARTFDLKGRYVGDKANKARGAYYGKKVLK